MESFHNPIMHLRVPAPALHLKLNGPGQGPTVIDIDSDGRSSSTRSSSLGLESNTGDDTRTPVIEFELSDLDPQPSLGLLDGALSFIAAERARWTAQREADGAMNEGAWKHVVSACRFHLESCQIRPADPRRSCGSILSAVAETKILNERSTLRPLCSLHMCLGLTNIL
jgi:hypothetical protein